MSYYQINKDHIKEYNLSRYHSQKHNEALMQKRRDYFKIWYEDTKVLKYKKPIKERQENRSQYIKQYRKENKEYFNSYCRRYYQMNKHKIRNYQTQRRKRKQDPVSIQTPEIQMRTQLEIDFTD
jgi:phosphotransacetylase